MLNAAAPTCLWILSMLITFNNWLSRTSDQESDSGSDCVEKQQGDSGQGEDIDHEDICLPTKPGGSWISQLCRLILILIVLVLLLFGS